MNALALITLAAILGSAVSIFLKIGLREFPPFALTFFRFALALLTFLPFYFWKKTQVSWADLRVLIPISFLSSANILLFIFGLNYTSASIAQTLYAGVPTLAAIFSYLILREKFNLKKIAGIAIGFFGVLIIVLLPVLGNKSAFNGSLFGNLLISAGAVSFSLYTVFSKKLQQIHSPFVLTFFFVLTTAAASLVILPFENKFERRLLEDLSLESFGILLYLSVVGVCLFYFLYQTAIKKASPLVSSTILYLTPVFTVVLAAVILGERPTTGFFIGAGLALLGTGIINTVNHSA